jgi:myo-inositol-1(or 4)-monophosphatase
VACGRLDGYWEFGLRPWDIAAGALIVEEAGGHVTALDGTPLKLDGKSLLAANQSIHKQMSRFFKEQPQLQELIHEAADAKSAEE